ncbi:MAG TPA: hypothetical protein VMD59_11395, partial [Acidimicrobiales bacterium]|nr:hypothetical protein [Acidimicrobiales bacterium]
MTIFQENDGDGPGFQFTPLTQQYRADIVSLGSNTTMPGAAYLAGNTLELTALGANVDILGAWDSTASNLAGYHHIAVTGRDTYVKIVVRGYLFPFGHQATIIAIYERVVLADPKKAASYADAYVGSKFYVRPVELTKSYPA